MLERFEVTNYKNFQDTFVLDLSDVKDYQFNKECVKNSLVNKAIIYGKNARGKSNLGRAISDIKKTIIDSHEIIDENFLNYNSTSKSAKFKYVFKFDDDHVVYEYSKRASNIIQDEKLQINNEIVFERKAKENSVKGNLEEINAENLNWQLLDENIAALRYIYANTMQKENSVIIKLYNFIRNMTFVRPDLYSNDQSLNQSVSYIVRNNLTEEFRKFINKYGIACNLNALELPSGDKRLFFTGRKNIPFIECASSGTKALTIFFYWFKSCAKNGSFVFLDEFDAFYHYELSEKIVDFMKKINCQSFFTTHNTNLLSNSIMRPDCFFILTDGKITNLSKATQRELREGHNLEKLYQNGEFDA